MSDLPITSVAAAVAALALVVLSFLVSLGRMKAKVLIGDGGVEMLLRRVRAQGNFIEYVPVGLILIGLLEMSRASEPLLWSVVVALGLGRLAHAVGMYADILAGRAIGSLLTYGALLTAAGTLGATHIGR